MQSGQMLCVNLMVFLAATFLLDVFEIWISSMLVLTRNLPYFVYKVNLSITTVISGYLFRRFDGLVALNDVHYRYYKLGRFSVTRTGPLQKRLPLFPLLHMRQGDGYHVGWDKIYKGHKLEHT